MTVPYEKLYTDTLKDYTTDLGVVQDRIITTTEDLQEQIDVLSPVEGVAYPTFNDLWGQFSTSYQYASYYKDPFDRVHLIGMVSSNGSSSGVIFTLPDGYRPPSGIIFICQGDSSSERVQVLDTGDVFIVGAIPLWLSLAGISFRAA